MHATWNFLLKRVGGSQVAVALSKVVEVVAYAPVFLVWSLGSLPPFPVASLLVGVSAAGVLATYAALAGAYRHGDLSFVYPISRGAALAMLPGFGALFLGERLGWHSGAALMTIVAGILVLQLPSLSRDAARSLGAALRQPASRYALLAALATAAFTAWDKRAIRTMQPFAYMYLYTCVVAAVWGGWTWRRSAPDERRDTWHTHRWAIVGIGVLNTASYLLTLVALRQDATSLVIGLRQLSIVIGVGLGAWRLGERLTPPRVLGTALIAAGCLAIAIG